MSRPSFLMIIRQTLGRALRETGQFLDRIGIQGQQLATTKRVIGDDPLIYQDFLSRHRHQMPLLRRGRPIVSKDVAFLAPCSTLIGSVYIGPGSSVFYKAILRADNCENVNSHQQTTDIVDTPQQYKLGDSDLDDGETTQDERIWELDQDRFLRENTQAIGGGIFIGENTNVQDGCIIDSRKDHTIIGNGVTIGHLASIHSATIHDNSLIGMGSLIQEGAVINEESFIAAGAVVSSNTEIPSGELWVGNPARKVRDLTTEERQKLHFQASSYVDVATSQSGAMELGGNLPTSLSKYLMLGYNNDDDNDNEKAIQQESTTQTDDVEKEDDEQRQTMSS